MIANRYINFNGTNTEELHRAANEEYLESLRNILGVDEQQYKELEREVAVNREKKLQREKVIENLTADIQVLIQVILQD